MSSSTPTPKNPTSRAKLTQKIRVDVQRSREKKPWEVEDIPSAMKAAQRYFPGNEVWQTDNSGNESVVKALPASNLIRETMAPPTIDAWPRKQNKISSLSQKPSDAENIPPLMKKLNKLVWEGLRSVGLLVDKCMNEYERDQNAHEIDCANSTAGTFSELSTSRLVLEVIHRFMDNIALLEKTQRQDCEDVHHHHHQTGINNNKRSSASSTRPPSSSGASTAAASSSSSPYSIEEQKKLALELVEENKRVKKVLKDLCNTVARWSVFEQAGDIFSKCFATYEAAITEVMKECADSIDEVLSIFISEISSLRKRLADSKVEIRTHLKERNVLVAEKEQFRLQAENAFKEKQDAIMKFLTKEKELKSVRFEIEDREKTIAKVNEENDLLSKQFTAQEAKISKLSGQLASANQKIESLNIHVAELKRNVAQSESVASECAQETLALRQTLVSAKGANINLKSDLNKLQSDRTLLRQQLSLATTAAADIGNHASSMNNNNNNNMALSMNNSSVSFAPSFVPPFTDINEWIETSCRMYVDEVNKRLDSAFYGDSPFFDLRNLLLQQHSATFGSVPSFVAPHSAETQTSGVHQMMVGIDENRQEGSSSSNHQNQSGSNEANKNETKNSSVETATVAIATTTPQQQGSTNDTTRQQKPSNASNSSNNNNTTTTISSNNHQLHHPDIKSRNPTAVQILTISDQISRPFFVGMGEDSNVPLALRYVGKIPNFKFGTETVSNLIIAFFRDTAENFPKHVLADTFDYSYQIIYSAALLSSTSQSSSSQLSSSSKRKSVIINGTQTPPQQAHSRKASQSNIFSVSTINNNTNTDQQQGNDDLLSTNSIIMSNSQSKSLLHSLNHWIAFHLDCEDACPPLYNILYAARWHSNSPVCRFLDAAVRFDAPPALWFAISEAINLFKNTLENSVPDVFSITEVSVQEAVRKTFSTSLSPNAITKISAAVHHFFQEQMDNNNSNSQHQQKEISLRSVFNSGMDLSKRKHRRLLISRQTKEDTTSPILWASDSVDENQIVREIRNECLLSWFDLISELSESVIDRAIISPEGHVSPYSVADAILYVDPMRPKSSMDKIMQTLFGKEVVPEHLKNIFESSSDVTTATAVLPNNNIQQSPLVKKEKSFGNISSFGDSEDHQQQASSAVFDPSAASSVTQRLLMNQNAEASASETFNKNLDHLTQEEREVKLQRLLEQDLLNHGGNDDEKKRRRQNMEDDEDGGNSSSNATHKNYSELYRNKRYTHGDTLLVHEALARLKMVPVARYTPYPEDNTAI